MPCTPLQGVRELTALPQTSWLDFGEKKGRGKGGKRERKGRGGKESERERGRRGEGDKGKGGRRKKRKEEKGKKTEEFYAVVIHRQEKPW